ncbi:ISL3 family transposase [Burkholderia multivorans]|jgi:transposase|uniref:ISBmu25 truncated transposase n=2 Tax=Burkholderia multivorans TaxID=87883 RepID=A0A0H3KKT3_BURM1|nr:ISL3 family transposase [Burkholderia multivorans]BAG45632.1 ISBmu25 truncated transposase [Burkholderia multivorans ATCC 17616]OXH93646.1 ISL3 family transposase [Burkholderia multivorans]PRF12357.1 ISL3 family transposase [Burkholderia multivorans]PRF34897.1 ISL3 family transposase [Burkholderia multivorans]
MSRSALANLSDVSLVAIDETSYRRGHEYLTLVSDMKARRVVFVTPDRDAKTIERFASYLGQHRGTPEQVTSVSIDMSPAFSISVDEHLPNARVTFDKFRVVANASKALDTVRRQQQKADPERQHALDAAQGRQQTESCAIDGLEALGSSTLPSVPPAHGCIASNCERFLNASKSMSPPRVCASDARTSCAQKSN